MSVNRGGDVAFRIPSEPALEPECTSLSCELSAAATEPGVVTAVAIAGLLALVTFAYVRDAETVCRRERRRVTDEHDAFEEFADRVAALDPCPTETTEPSAAAPSQLVGTRRNGGGRAVGDVRLRRVLDTYRDTVMSLPHYSEEYDETVAESLAAELGPDTTVSLASNGTLSPALQSALVDRSRRAAAARRSLADAIDVELDALADAEESLSGIDRRRSRLNQHLDGIPHGRRADASIDVWERLDDLESECDAVAADRQSTLRDPPMSPERVAGDCETGFYEYLYAPMDGPNHPVLASVATVVDRIREDRDRVARRIADGV
ncbi:hypothetical protein SAMN04488066_102107 [Halorubrum aquaticum]|uniref:DUF7260 domain-containing protein n=1 Tax=Halorubrum aquaticum TaxID=387340 RepID=A0A1I2ZHL7_9EURY|nr:hypothetical protein [Halorubrum aquaticum]SFH37230.1 hypothetical protein SAMN04488066_102107 [Halorubrum aquaticum]